MSDQARRAMKDTQTLTLAMDKDNEIQACCFSSPDSNNSLAWTIDFLIAAPHNISTKAAPPKYQGAATALIEDVVQRALARQKMTPKDLNAKTSKKVAITLQAFGSSKKFYKTTFFRHYRADVKIRGVNTRILTGDRLISFLQKYGGRAST